MRSARSKIESLFVVRGEDLIIRILVFVLPGTADE